VKPAWRRSRPARRRPPSAAINAPSVELQHVEQAAVGAMVAVEQRAELGEQPAAAQAVVTRATEPASSFGASGGLTPREPSRAVRRRAAAIAVIRSSAPIRSEPWRSASVRARRRTRSWPRALSVPRSRARASSCSSRSRPTPHGRAACASHLRVERHAIVAQPGCLTFACIDHALAGLLRADARRICERIACRVLEAREHVDPVEQRAAEAPSVAGEVGFAAAAQVTRAGVAARAGVGRREEHEARRMDRAVACPGDRHASILQRLAQRLERVARELGELVEEQHAMMCEHDLADAIGSGAADEARRGGRVVWSAQRTLASRGRSRGSRRCCGSV